MPRSPRTCTCSPGGPATISWQAASERTALGERFVRWPGFQEVHDRIDGRELGARIPMSG
jgi:hypothetical protein